MIPRPPFRPAGSQPPRPSLDVKDIGAEGQQRTGLRDGEEFSTTVIKATLRAYGKDIHLAFSEA